MGKFKIQSVDRVIQRLQTAKENLAKDVKNIRGDIQPDELAEGIPTFKKTHNGLMSYVKVNGIIYESKYKEYKRAESLDASLPDYDSGWFTAANNNEYVKEHNLNSQLLRFVVYFKGTSGGTERIFCLSAGQHEEGSFDTGVYIWMKNRNSIEIATANTYIYFHDNFSFSGSHTKYSSGKLRVLAWRTGILE
jgi:hypothetical protein